MQSIGFSKGEKDNYENVKEKVLDSLKQHFRPEFLNRLDDIIVFDVLTKEAIKSIVSIQIDMIEKRLEDKDITLTISDKVADTLAQEGYNPQYGARPLKRLIQEKILNSVASLMINGKVGPKDTVMVELVDGQFTFETKKSGKPLKQKLNRGREVTMK